MLLLLLFLAAVTYNQVQPLQINYGTAQMQLDTRERITRVLDNPCTRVNLEIIAGKVKTLESNCDLYVQICLHSRRALVKGN